jgi:DNA polymerase III epsilon subunit-like protein
MAGIRGGMSVLVYVCAVNYLTGETILNTLVRPNGHVIDWRTRYSGVTEELMTAAANRGETLNGWKEARAQLWEYIDADTVLVGHALHHDLDALRMIHNRVVDSSILASSAVNPTKISGWGLRRLCGQLLDMHIQDHGRSGHDCLEDTLATRELVLFCTLNPQHLETWAEKRREEEKAKEEQIRMERERRKRDTERENEKEQEGIKRQLHDIRS